jgi:hypothetical protein
MKHGCRIAGAVILLLSIAGAWAQTLPSDAIDISPGFKLRPNGLIDIGEISAEVYHFNGDWTISEQHDIFQPAEKTPPTTEPSSHVVSGVFTSASGPFNLTERIAAADGLVSFSAAVASDKVLDTNELSVAFSLPVKSVGGKQIMIDKQPFTLPAEPAKQGEAILLDQENVHQIEIPMPTGTLTITGNLNLHLQDDREWGDPRYGMRLLFTPAAGQIKQSKIDFQLKWKATGG